MYESTPIAPRDASPVIGLVLGSGAARGWSHLGVLRALAKLGVRIDVVSGCSIGALVGAALASGRSDELESWARFQRQAATTEADGWAQRLFGAFGLAKGERGALQNNTELPSLPDVVTTSINIMQMRIARSRLAGEPADVVISPRVAHMSMMEFDRANEAIEEGEAAVERNRGLLDHALESG